MRNKAAEYWNMYKDACDRQFSLEAAARIALDSGDAMGANRLLGQAQIAARRVDHWFLQWEQARHGR
jgi:hypothetical protein